MTLCTLIAAALLAAATLSTAATFGDYKPVGFLSDYSRLKHKAGTEAYSWSEPAAQIGAYDIETRAAKKFDVHLSEGIGSAVGKGVTGYADSFSTWAYTKKAMEHWADLIGAWLESARSA